MGPQSNDSTMKFLTIFYCFSATGATSPKHIVGGPHTKEKPWIEFTKKWTGGRCIWTKEKRDDCAICVNGACPCPAYQKNRCYDCKDKSICIADGTKMAPYKIWTKPSEKCECQWKRKLGKSCA